MTRIEVDAGGIAALGERIADVADYLQVRADYTRDAVAERYGFHTPEAVGAFDGVLGDYELDRVRLCEALRGLSLLAGQAGGCYLDTERLLTRTATPVRVDGGRGLR